MTEVPRGLRSGCVAAPPSKSHAHRLLIANFLAGDRTGLVETMADSADICATKRCLRALEIPDRDVVLPCGESGSTLRFLAPVAAALGHHATFQRVGRLADRPFRAYETIASGLHELPGDVSSQFVTGLLLALPILSGDSQIRFTTPLESRGYVDMTCDVLRGAGVKIRPVTDGFDVPGNQTYRPQTTPVEGDWSGAAFWYGLNALGSAVRVTGLNSASVQPDRAIDDLTRAWPSTIDMSGFPDLFPVLVVIAAARMGETRFTGIRRLRLKECDRVAAMEETARKLGVSVRVTADSFVVDGRAGDFYGGDFSAFGDHRIAMAVAVAASRATSPVRLDDCACSAKSYPGFFETLERLPRIAKNTEI